MRVQGLFRVASIGGARAHTVDVAFEPFCPNSWSHEGFSLLWSYIKLGGYVGYG